MSAIGASLGIQLAPATEDGRGLVVHELSETGAAKQGTAKRKLPPSTSFFVDSRTLMGCTDLLGSGVGTPPVPSRFSSKLPHLC